MQACLQGNGAESDKSDKKDKSAHVKSMIIALKSDKSAHVVYCKFHDPETCRYVIREVMRTGTCTSTEYTIRYEEHNYTIAACIVKLKPFGSGAF